MSILSYYRSKKYKIQLGSIFIILLIFILGHIQQPLAYAKKKSDSANTNYSVEHLKDNGFHAKKRPDSVNTHYSVKHLKDNGSFDKDKCGSCHKQMPDNFLESISTLVDDYNLQCLSCHTNLPKSCTLILKPENYNIIKQQMPDFPLPLSLRKVTCASCHLFHKSERLEDREYKLRDDYYIFMHKAESINPHKSGLFCFLCHYKPPKEKGGNLHLKYGQDTIRICKDCHNNKRAAADNHPVGVIPSKGKEIEIPKDFPLKNKKITCLTCHILKCQGETSNVLLLRGGPYITRIDTCLVCHVKDKYKKDNPHKIISEDGEIRQDRCEYCHSVDKDETGETGEKKFGYKFSAPFRQYCVGCHPVKTEKHPFGASHTGRHIDAIWSGITMTQRIQISHDQSFKMTPVSLTGTVMCASCHNPHDPRPGPKLRISDLNQSCRQCHFRQYGDEFSIDINNLNINPDDKDTTPSGEDYQPFGYRASLRFYCIGCHPNKDTKHPYGIDHNGRFIKKLRNIDPEKRARLSQVETSQFIPLPTSGQVACFSCHDPHEKKKGPKLRIKEKDILCSICHADHSSVIESYKTTKE